METNDKIKKLTDRIYLEGIEKAKSEADLIILSAKKEAENIIKTAKTKELEIVDQMQKYTLELKQNTEAEIRLAARQFTSNLKQQISELITNAQIEAPVKEAFNDKEFVQNIMLTIIKNWNPQNPDEMNISLLLPEKDEKELNNFFISKAKTHLNSGLEINFLPSMKSGFKIGPKDGSYYISFTDTDFENYFKNYLKEKTKQLLFD
ncbi:MAG: hypothetical protein PF517_21375 [Salinivirgaceae bacterium]|jgi:V/A-type H+-transporting ATPase subunit E|nr:hypothetical protein [Salinivirgaceae bacterium]